MPPRKLWLSIERRISQQSSMLAVQVDRKMAPSPDAVPMLQFVVQPSEAGGFEPVNKSLPMRFSVIASNARSAFKVSSGNIPQCGIDQIEMGAGLTQLYEQLE